MKWNREMTEMMGTNQKRYIKVSESKKTYMLSISRT